jgi:hypothetical protein
MCASRSHTIESLQERSASFCGQAMTLNKIARLDRDGYQFFINQEFACGAIHPNH